MRRRAHEIVISRLPRAYPVSSTPLTILIPLAEKDVEQAGLVIQSLRKHVKHPIEDVLVVGQDSDIVRDFCARAKVAYRNEIEFLANYLSHEMVQKHGWIRQQLIKLSAFERLDTDTIFVQDSDTLLLRDISFMDGDRQVFSLADEYTKRYGPFLQAMLGDVPRHPRSFVAHSMLLQRKIMDQLNAFSLARSGNRLIEALLAYVTDDNFRSVSEFELYGNFMYNFCPEEFRTRYWYNCKVKDMSPEALPGLYRRYGRFNSVSRHVYID